MLQYHIVFLTSINEKDEVVSCLILILLVNSLDGGFVGLTLNIDQHRPIFLQSFSNQPKIHSQVGYGGP